VIKKRLLALFAILAVIAGIFPFASAYAYPTDPSSTPPTTQSIQSSFQNLFAPFQNFFESLKGAIGDQPVVGNPSNMPQVPTLQVSTFNTQNVNTTNVVTELLKGTIWVLSLVQQFVQWLLNLVNYK
jgi:hypothetical protein